MSKMALKPEETIVQYAERIAMRFAIITGILFAAIVIIANIGRNPIPMMDDRRAFGTLLFLMLLPTTLIFSGYGFVLGVKAWNDRVADERDRRWAVPVLFIAVAYTLVVGFITVVGLTLIEFGFQYLELANLQAAFIAGAVGAAVIYFVTLHAIDLRNGEMLTLAIIIIAGGVYVTAVAMEDPLWWKVSFSYLGKYESNAHRIFNFTMAFAGVLLMVWAQFFINDVKVLVRHGAAQERSAKIVVWLLIALGVAIILVGFFPSSSTNMFSDKMHLVGAYSLGAIFAVLMAGVQWLAPGYPREFMVISWILVGLLVATLLLAGLGVFNTVGLEMIAFVLGMTWLALFASNTETKARELEPEAFPV